MGNLIDIVLEDGTEIGLDNKENLFIHNEVIRFKTIYENGIFCYGDIEYITKKFKSFIKGELKETVTVNTLEPYLTLVLFPKRVEIIRKEEEVESVYNDASLHETIQRYEESLMKIEIDLCLDGVFGRTFWVAYLTAEETIEFINQWFAIYNQH